jgi:hypothetical protein
MFSLMQTKREKEIMMKDHESTETTPHRRRGHGTVPSAATNGGIDLRITGG